MSEAVPGLQAGLGAGGAGVGAGVPRVQPASGPTGVDGLEPDAWQAASTRTAVATAIVRARRGTGISFSGWRAGRVRRGRRGGTGRRPAGRSSGASRT